MNRSLFQKVWDTPWNPNKLYGSGSWDFDGRKNPGSSNPRHQYRFGKYVLRLTLTTVVMAAIVLGAYQLDLVKWVDSQMESFISFAQGLPRKEGNFTRKSNNSKKKNKEKRNRTVKRK